MDSDVGFYTWNNPIRRCLAVPRDVGVARPIEFCCTFSSNSLSLSLCNEMQLVSMILCFSLLTLNLLLQRYDINCIWLNVIWDLFVNSERACMDLHAEKVARNIVQVQSTHLKCKLCDSSTDAFCWKCNWYVILLISSLFFI